MPSAVSAFWRHFITNGTGGHHCRSLGLYGFTVPVAQSIRENLKLNHHRAIEIWQTANGPARAAGILPGDMIIAMSRRPLATMEGLDRLLRAAPAKAITLTVIREDCLHECVIVRDDSPSRANG